MSESPSPVPPRAAVRDEAAAWLARCDRGLTRAETDAFESWRQADPQHARALGHLDAAWRRLDRLRELQPDWRQAVDPDRLAPVRRPRRAWPVLAGLAAAAALALAYVGWWWQPASAPGWRTRSYSTPLGGYRSITLPDGTVAELNTASAITVHWLPTARMVDLLQGEVMLTVAADPARPFQVRVGTATITDVGTAFSVRRRAAAVDVLVQRGRVRVDRPADPPAGMVLLLVANQRATVPFATGESPSVTPLQPEDVVRALAWRTGRLEFSDTPLAETVVEFNRYNRVKLRIGDPAIAGLRIGGSFRSDNVEGFVRLLQSGFGVSAEHRRYGEVVLRKRP